jgi:hypothetical protein
MQSETSERIVFMDFRLKLRRYDAVPLLGKIAPRGGDIIEVKAVGRVR